jgi:threonyl-tRNA synthetase
MGRGSGVTVIVEGSSRTVPAGTTAAEVLNAGKDVLAARVDGRLVDLSAPVPEGAVVEAVTFLSPEGREVYRHSASHLMAQSVKRLFPRAKVSIGPAIEDGYYYDFDIEPPLTEEDLPRIEAEMARIIGEDLPVRREELSRDEAVRLFADQSETYKVEIVQELPAGQAISVYRQGEFVDLCRGPHVPSTGRIGAVKLLSLAGAYWRGDERNKMLQRVYGTSFPTREEVDAYLARLEEIKKRDHRRLGRDLDLFSIPEETGAGLVLWHPKGARVRQIIEDHWREEHRKGGYEVVYTPHMARLDLWKTSGHLDFYKENMFSPMEVEGTAYEIKPMNCPFHIMIYKSRIRSYRDLPIRWAELGTVYRYERSGVLHGLMRVRGFTQDDAHIFCRPDQVEGEIRRVLAFTLDMLAVFGFREYEIFLSTRPSEAVGEPGEWHKAEGALRAALDAAGLSYGVDEGGGAFYGPKIDIKIKDSLGRAWQCGTIQFDFNLPRRFDLFFTNDRGEREHPYMVHRALLGSLERFFGVLVEHYGGAFPAWLAPVQVRVLPVTDAQAPYAESVEKALNEREFRVESDLRSEKIGAKVRDGAMQKIPYLLVVGKREAGDGAVSVRARGGVDLGAMPLDAFMSGLEEEVRLRANETRLTARG